MYSFFILGFAERWMLNPEWSTLQEQVARILSSLFCVYILQHCMLYARQPQALVAWLELRLRLVPNTDRLSTASWLQAVCTHTRIPKYSLVRLLYSGCCHLSTYWSSTKSHRVKANTMSILDMLFSMKCFFHMMNKYLFGVQFYNLQRYIVILLKKCHAPKLIYYVNHMCILWNERCPHCTKPCILQGHRVILCYDAHSYRFLYICYIKGKLTLTSVVVVNKWNHSVSTF